MGWGFHASFSTRPALWKPPPDHSAAGELVLGCLAISTEPPTPFTNAPHLRACGHRQGATTRRQSAKPSQNAAQHSHLSHHLSLVWLCHCENLQRSDYSSAWRAYHIACTHPKATFTRPSNFQLRDGYKNAISTLTTHS